jgi:hypothetical protein
MVSPKDEIYPTDSHSTLWMPAEGSLRRTPAFLAALTCFSRLLLVAVPVKHTCFDTSLPSSGAVRF